jgi:hypothetical protein
MGRPNKTEAIAKKKRNDEIALMREKGYPLDYIASYFSLSKGRIVQISNEVKGGEHQK